MTESAAENLATTRLKAALNSPRFRRWGKWLAIAVVAVGVLGFFAAPPLLKSILIKQLGNELQREVAIERIDVNPYALSLRVAGLSVHDAAGKEVFGFDELFVNLSAASFYKFAAAVDELRLRGPRLQIARLADGRYDVSDLIDKWTQPKDEPDSGPPRFSLNNIQVVDGKIVFDDQPKGKVHTVEGLQIGIPFVSSLPYQAEIVVQPSFFARIDGSELFLGGDSKPFSETHESHLSLDLDHFDLAGVQPYLPESLPLRLAAGKLDSELKAVFKEAGDQVFSLTLVGSAHVSGLKLREPNGKPLLGWQRLDVELDSADLINRRVAVRRVALEGLEATAAVDRRGELNWLRVAERLAGPPAPAPAKAPAATQAATPALAWSLDELVLSKGRVNWQDESNAPAQQVELRDLELRVGKLDSKLAAPLELAELSFRVDAGEDLQIGRLAAHGTKIDLAARRVTVAAIDGGQVQGKLVRGKDGRIDWLAPPQLKPDSPAKGRQPAAAQPWRGEIASLKLDGIGLRFEDRGSSPALVQRLEGFSVTGEHLGNLPGQPGTLAVKGKVNDKGRIDLAGKLQLEPFDAALKIETVALPLMPLQPYFGQYLNVALTRGQLSNKGEATVSLAGDKLKAAYKGSLTLGDLLAVDKLNSADFLKWKSLYVGAIDFRLEPLAVNIGEIALSDFYSRLILNESGRLNLADIVRQPEGEAAPAQAKAAPAKPEPAKAPVPIRIAKVSLQNGTVNFSDFFVKPNYSVNLSRLAGRVTGLSSAEGTTADLDLRGSYANTAPVQILAKLNPLTARSYLDLKGEITGVDMVGFSPYSGKYAGYAIEKGKLSLNVAYKLEDGKLNAQNKLFVDQFTFGDKVESPDATTLPVNLAIALLKNNRGEIDLNLPIAGSLDDPEFSVGGLIVKVIVNLFVKAVTSPFALLGSLFGGGEELSNVEFAPGYASLDAAAVKRLETLARALNERSALKLEIAGRADPESDREGLKRAGLERAMQVEKLKEMTRKGGEGKSVDEIRIEPAEYALYLTRAYKAAKFPKPRNLIGLQKDLPVEEMEKLMLTHLTASDDDVRALAVRRAETVQAWLVEQGKVAPERVFLLPPKIAAEREAKAKSSRADFSLK